MNIKNKVFFVSGLFLIFILVLTISILNRNASELEEKYAKAIEECKFVDEHFRFKCYKDLVESFLEEHPNAQPKFYAGFLPSIIQKDDLKKERSLYMATLSTNCHVFMHAVGEVHAERYFKNNQEEPDSILKILSTECRLGDRVGAIVKMAEMKNFEGAYIEKLRASCLQGIAHAGEADMQQCAHALGHVYFDKYVFATSRLHGENFSTIKAKEVEGIKSSEMKKAFSACAKLSPLEISACNNAVGHSLFEVSHFLHHNEIRLERDFSFVFEKCNGAEEFKEVCYKAVTYRIGLNEAGPYFLTGNYNEGNGICNGISENLGGALGSFCYRGIGAFLGQIAHEYGENDLVLQCENINQGYKGQCYKSAEEWIQYLKTRKIDHSSNKKSSVVSKMSSSGLFIAGKFIGSEGANGLNEPALMYIDLDNNFSFQDIGLAKFNFAFEGIHEARQIRVNNGYKIALGAHYIGDDNPSVEFVILNNANGNLDNLQVELNEQVGDARIRAVFVEDIDNDGEEEIVIGTRPHGILKYYKFIENKWIGFDIDFLNETIHDIVVADINGNGKKEILATVSPLSTDGTPPVDGSSDITGRIISYELNPGKNTWQKEVVWAYNKTFTKSLIENRGFLEHPRYIFASDTDGDGSKEIVVNVLGSQNIELLKWNGSGYSREIIEDKLDMHDSAITVGDIDNDGEDEVIALTLAEHTLVLYNYNDKTWKREVLADDLREGENTAVRYLYVLEPASDLSGKIIYAIEPSDNAINAPGSNSSIYYLERTSNIWTKKYIGSTNRPMVSWGIFPF